MLVGIWDNGSIPVELKTADCIRWLTGLSLASLYSTLATFQLQERSPLRHSQGDVGERTPQFDYRLESAQPTLKQRKQ